MSLVFHPMQRSEHSFIRPVAVLALAAGLVAPVVLQANTPYDVIVERNPFGLKPPPPPGPVEPEKPPEPPAGLDLTGITTFEGEKRAHFTVKSKDGKTPPEPKTFREGQRQDQIEVISIDAEKGAVRLRNSGIETVVSFETHGAKVPVGAVPIPTPPGSPLIRPAGIPGIPQPPGMPQGIGVNPAAPAIPTRSIRVPPLPQGAPQGSGITVPNASGGIADAGNGSPAAQPNNLTVEQVLLLMEANRIYDNLQRERGIPVPPMPPTPLTQR
jgi:hypothetical protein